MPSSGKAEPLGPSTQPKTKKSSSGHSGSKRRGDGSLNANERRMYQLIVSAEQHTMLADEVNERCGDMPEPERVDAINSLSGKSLLTMRKSYQGLVFVAVSKSEANVMGQLEDDEAIVYSYIRDAQNEGIWTKQLKSKSGLHQTIITRTLKSLESKSLIKAVKSVKFPTRKIYMLKKLQPSVELSGGPWYTDHELDTAFIEQLCTLLDSFICQQTWPESNGKRRKAESEPQPLLPASRTSSLPTAARCLKWLMSKNVTDTKLTVDDIQCLLDVLVYDGKIEKVPKFDLGGGSHSKRRNDSDGEYDPRGKREGYDTASSSGSDDEDESVSASATEDTQSESGDGSRRRTRKRRKSSPAARKTGKDRNSSKRSKSRSRKSSGRSSSSSKQRGRRGSVSNDSDNTSASEDGRDRKRKSIRLTSDDEDESEASSAEDGDAGLAGGTGTLGVGGFVYRAIRPLQMRTGWTDVPCAHCPVINFCEPGGPVNAEGCIYMRDWLTRSKKREDEERAAMAADVDVSMADDANYYYGPAPGTKANGKGRRLDAAEQADAPGGGDNDEDDFEPLDEPEELSGVNDYEDDDYGGEEV